MMQPGIFMGVNKEVKRLDRFQITINVSFKRFTCNVAVVWMFVWSITDLWFFDYDTSKMHIVHGDSWINYTLGYFLILWLQRFINPCILLIFSYTLFYYLKNMRPLLQNTKKIKLDVLFKKRPTWFYHPYFITHHHRHDSLLDLT